MEHTHTFDEAAMLHYLRPDHSDLRNDIYKMFGEPLFQNLPNMDVHSEISVRQLRDINAERLKVSCARKFFGVRDLQKAPGRYMAFIESLACPDGAFGMKLSVHFNLYGAAILYLGTEVHEHLLNACDDFSLPGCFAMTELGHGSNVMQLETTATYLPDTQQFEIHSPTVTAQKFWIGNSAQHGRMAVVFAQLRMSDGAEHGLHAFVVPLRDDQMRLMEGVEIFDCGHKMGMQGLDNGRIRFTHVRIPRQNLLNRYANVSADGEYSSVFSRASERFAAHVGPMLIARIVVGTGGLVVAKYALDIAIRYSLSRRQFGPPGQPETPIMDYLTQQRRLFPRLADAYALWFFHNYVKQRYAARSDADLKEIHILCAAYKAYTTWHATETLQAARECCGGQGYLSKNLLASLRCDAESFVTVDGDNFVLLQQISRQLVTEYGRMAQSQTLLNKVTVVGRQARVMSVFNAGFTTRHSKDASESTVSDMQWQLDVFQARVFRLTETLALRLRNKVTSDKVSGTTAWNYCLDHVTSLGRAYMECAVLEQNIKGVRACPQAELQTPLAKLCCLYGLTRIEAEPWFLSSGCISTAQFHTVRQVVNDLCLGYVRNNAFSYVASFASPDYILNQTCANPEYFARL
eukprot:TRINITY_DN3020_c0_g1_i4.p1 TRINITY_DN3020_c0_g1~~TRINITY_DN3020_c0_g1_i4.p1  ORF type:complete len:633 (+),score=100.84 TRINITY_DN3020_c0_g1_i4:2322-4220(+)